MSWYSSATTPATSPIRSSSRGLIRDRSLITYAVWLLDSESPKNYLSGTRLLGAFVKKNMGEYARPLLIRSTPKIQKLLDTLRQRSSSDEGREVRYLAPVILADLAGDIDLAHYHGALRCISSLLEVETTQAYWNSNQEDHNPQSSQQPEEKSKRHRQRSQEKQGTADVQKPLVELILQGLTILERLASDHNNCVDICSAPGLLRKITVPIYSNTLVQDIGISGAWAHIVNGSFKVLHRLICAPGETSRSMRLDITSADKPAVSNLVMILEQGNGICQQLKIQAMKILTELALDSSIKLPEKTKNKIINKQLQIFLADDGEQEPASLPNPLRITAGRTLVLTLTSSQTNSSFIKKAYDNDMWSSVAEDKNTAPHLTEVIIEDKKNIVADLSEITEDKKTIDDQLNEITEDNNNVAHLTKLLDATNNITCRTIAAEILEKFCTHCNWNKHKQIVKESLLPKVLAEIPSSKIDQPEKENKPESRRWIPFRNKNNRGNQRNSAPRKDVEKQQTFALGTDDPSQGKCALEEKNKIQKIPSSGDQKKSSGQQNEEQTATKELQEALLSLAMVICDKLISENDVQEKDLGGESFVVKLKTIIDGNCQPTANSLRIVKLCGQIAASMMQFQPYAEHFRNKEFVQSLSKASKIMSSLESCMMFAGTDFGLKKTVRPLLSEVASELEKKALQSV